MKDRHTDDQKSNKTSIIYFKKMGSQLFDCCLDSLSKRILNDMSKKKCTQRWRKGTLFEKKVVDKSTEIKLPVKNGPVTKFTEQSLIPETIKTNHYATD
jgi:hypothetical protein